MAFTSDIGGIKVITASNMSVEAQKAFAHGQGEGYGLQPRDFERVPYGSIAPEFTFQVFDWQEIRERIIERERTKSRNCDRLRAKGFTYGNQSRTNYCWMHGCVNMQKGTRILRNMPHVDLSPAGAAAPIKNFRNVGGWGGEALEWLKVNGVPEVKFYPANVIDRDYYTEETKANAKKHLVTDWEDVKPRDLQVLFSALISDLLCPVAFNWWRHLVGAVDPVILGNDKYGLMIFNSHNDGDFLVLEGSRAVPDDVQVIRAVSSAYPDGI